MANTYTSYSKSDVQNVIKYIQNQELHHKTITFEAEYSKLPDEFNIEYDGRYILKSVNYYAVPKGTGLYCFIQISTRFLSLSGLFK